MPYLMISPSNERKRLTVEHLEELSNSWCQKKKSPGVEQSNLGRNLERRKNEEDLAGTMSIFLAGFVVAAPFNYICHL